MDLVLMFIRINTKTIKIFIVYSSYVGFCNIIDKKIE